MCGLTQGCCGSNDHRDHDVRKLAHSNRRLACLLQQTWVQAYAAKHESPDIITDELASVSGAALVDVHMESVEGFKVRPAFQDQSTHCYALAAAAAAAARGRARSS